MTEERKEDLIREWDESGKMDDEEYRDWYEGLSSEERSLIDEWDQQYLRGTQHLCEEILGYEKISRE